MVLSSNDFEHDYAPYNEDQKSYVAVPKPSLNGGLYTGEAFAPGAAYRNFPAPPDSVSLITNNLSSANPPPGAQQQFPDVFRPGNNLPIVNEKMKLNKYGDKYAIMCTKSS
jgi:hypothetical protein